MGYAAKILADSITNDGCRLTTFEVTLPRIVLAELNTHRMLSRNSASSRAIPVLKRIKSVVDDPFIPEAFGRNQKGMQAGGELDPEATARAVAAWLDARDAAVRHAHELAKLEVHKQLANRLLEPFLWHTVVLSATEWENFDALRCHPDAQPEIRKPSEMMRDLRASSVPAKIRYGEWHTPYLSAEEQEELIRLHGFSHTETLLVSIGRCARVSVKTHDGTLDPRADADLASRLRKSGHMSPLEHVAQAFPLPVWDVATRGRPAVYEDGFMGNFRGWKQFRKGIPHESNFALVQGST
jgi:hypothetical protein